MNTRKWSTRSAVIGGALFAVGIAGPAFAEGSFTSYMEGYHVEDESRQWVDKNLDNFNGYAQFENCNKASFRVTIYKEDLGPDTNVGSEVIQCKTGTTQTSDRVYAGDVGADEYHFTVKSINDSTGDSITVSADYVKVAW